MHLDISAQHLDLTPALSEAVKEKFHRLSTHSQKPLRAHVVLSVEAGVHRVNATVRGLGGKPLVASSQGPDMYAAINELAHILDRQWRKRKTKELKNTRQSEKTIRRSSP